MRMTQQYWKDAATAIVLLALSTSTCEGLNTVGSRHSPATSPLNAAKNSPLFRRKKVVLTSTYPDSYRSASMSASMSSTPTGSSNAGYSHILHMIPKENDESSSSSSQEEESGQQEQQPQNKDDDSNIAMPEVYSKGSSTLSQSLFRKIDEAGQMLKPMALEAREKASSFKDDKVKTILYSVQSCILFTLFMTYRAYRGFFVLLPAVFRQVYAKLETVTTETNPFDDDDDEDGIFDAKALETVGEDGSITTAVPQVPDKKSKVRFRTAVTTSILAGVVTASYVLGGAIRVLTKFIKTFIASRKDSDDSSTVKQHSVSVSFEAAANEMLVNEDKISRFTEKNKNEKKSTMMDSKDINGTKANGSSSSGNDTNNDNNNTSKKGWLFS
mmetsp:Transcript_26648/g.37552  ORF Transcript_26648/g.37552 Transcript_26648/m.37552 type:complete len:385 (-) Transcript_26648:201-1355(-)